MKTKNPAAPVIAAAAKAKGVRKLFLSDFTDVTAAILGGGIDQIWANNLIVEAGALVRPLAALGGFCLTYAELIEAALKDPPGASPEPDTGQEFTEDPDSWQNLENAIFSDAFYASLCKEIAAKA